MQTLKFTFQAETAQQLWSHANQNHNPKILCFRSTPTMKTKVDTSMRAYELKSLEQALSLLAEAKIKRRKRAIIEWRDEIEAMAMHSEYSDIRERAARALAN